MYKKMELEKYVILYGLTFSVGPDCLPAGEDQCYTAEFFSGYVFKIHSRNLAHKHTIQTIFVLEICALEI